LTTEHRRRLALIGDVAVRQIQRLARSADTADIDAWWDAQETAAVRVVTTGYGSAAELGARYMVDHAKAEGVSVTAARVRPNRQEIATALRVTGPVAFKQHMRLSGSEQAALQTMLQRLGGSANRLTLGGERAMVMRTFAQSRQIAGWQRVTSANACAFCSMLASRGAVYRRGGGVARTSDITFAAHDSCRCTAEPRYEIEPEPAWVNDLRTQWNDATAGLSGKEALAAFRQART
jgi:hypothetical protein